jgi:membrane protein
MLVILLTLFYRFFPNTSVKFKPALLGSLITACLLILNNYLSIVYVQRVLSFQSLYGSLGIIPVMMIGLYFFWLLVLLGGQLTYAAQNISFMANQTAWHNASPEGRELVTLAAFILVARRFLECKSAPTPNEISQHLRIPVNILNESLGILENLDWITRISREDGEREKEKIGFRPSKPLKLYNLSRFRSSFATGGNSDYMARLLQSDPVVDRYQEALQWHEEESFFQTALQDLLEGSGTVSS